MAEELSDRTGPRSLNTRERELQAIQLRSNGATYEQIATTLGYSQRDGAYKAVVRGLRRESESYAESTELARNMSVRRLDQITMAIMPLARQGDPASIDRIIRLEMRRAALLGLDAPKQIEARIQIDIMSWNQAVKDFLDLYREVHGTSDSATELAGKIDALSEERFKERQITI
jgi:hypothetical protein